MESVMTKTMPVFKMQGTMLDATDNSKRIMVVPGRVPRTTYLWVGSEPGPCFGTLAGIKTLRKLARDILKHTK
jgi:hypothetical protein